MLSPKIRARVDHLVYATPDLDLGIGEVERLLGIRAVAGGQHPVWATHNALAALSPTSYLEIVAPDPDNEPRAGTRPFGLDSRRSSRLVGWAAKSERLEEMRERAARLGVELGDILAGSRQPPEGPLITWRLTDLRCVVADGIVPFFIDWGRSPHPALFSPKGATLLGIRAEHPDANCVRRMLHGIGLDFPVEVGPAPALIAQIDCPNGRVELR